MTDTKKSTNFLQRLYAKYGFRKDRDAGPGQTLEDMNQDMGQRENELKLDLQNDGKELQKLQTCAKAMGIAFSVVTVITALLAVSLIAVSTMSAVAASAMDAQDDSGRLVALVVLAVTAAVTIAIVVYAQIATCSKKIRPIFVATVVLSVLMVIQGIIAGASVRVSPKDADHIQQSLKDSFDLAAKQHSPRHVKMWATTQSTFHCCGFQSPYDYTHNGLQTPDVPISCCPTYDSERSDLLQEKERFMCKDRREFFDTGCSGDVLMFISETAQWVFHVSTALIVFEVLSVILGGLLVKRRKELAKASEKENPDDKDAK